MIKWYLAGADGPIKAYPGHHAELGLAVLTEIIVGIKDAKPLSLSRYSRYYTVLAYE